MVTHLLVPSQTNNTSKSIYKGPNSAINGDTIDGNVEAVQKLGVHLKLVFKMASRSFIPTFPLV